MPTGKCRLREVAGQKLLTIRTGGRRRHYVLTRLDPDQRVAHPAFALENAEGEVWHVCQDLHGWRCDCPAHIYQAAKGPCKHSRAVQALWDKGMLR